MPVDVETYGGETFKAMEHLTSNKRGFGPPAILLLRISGFTLTGFFAAV